MYYAKKTENKSFINMWRYLQRNKIENNIFMLSVIDKDLINFSLNKFNKMNTNSKEYHNLRLKVLNEAKNNIWFYFRELLMIPDEYSEFNDYTHFELTPQSMMMIYMYDNNTSFINLSESNDVIKYIWNIEKSLYNSDIIITNKFDNISNIKHDIDKSISQTNCIILGSSQIISDGKNHCVSITESNIEKEIENRYDLFVKRNDWYNNKKSIFIIEDDPILITSYPDILSLMKKGYNIYLDGFNNNRTVIGKVIKKMLEFNFEYFILEFYDKKRLNSLYII